MTDVRSLSKLNELINQIRELAAGEYQRGVRETLARVVDVAQVEAKSPLHISSKSAEVPKRLPRGAARNLVERVLKAGPHTIQEIREKAETPTERLVSYQTARLELERGKKLKRYRNDRGRWTLNQ